MKRLLALLLAVTMLMGLCACGQAEENPAENSSTTTVTAVTTVAGTTTSAEAEQTTTDTTADATTIGTAATTTAPAAVTTSTVAATAAPTRVKVKASLGGVSLSDYTIVVAENCLDYVTRAADYIRDEIRYRTGAELIVVSDDRAAVAHEIVVGETNRPISKTLNAKTEGLQFSLLSKDGHVALEGNYFIIAAAAYYFITTYITGKNVAAKVPATTQVLNPIQEKANNYILCIGDGMGVEHTLLPKGYNKKKMSGEGVSDFTDGEDFFYGYLFPYEGRARTPEIRGYVTDSAASATALATGYKTTNGRIGRDKDANDLMSITELAASLGMNTAVMSTEGQTGATPSGFSAHADARDQYDIIKESQQALQDTYGTIIDCKYDHYDGLGVNYILKPAIQDTLEEVSQGDKGFFMMYEEAYIDKHSHNREKEQATWAVYRFNQAIATFMEFAFYHPDTMVIITADHETGGLTDMGGVLTYSHGDHTDTKVPIYAYGIGAEVFHDKEIENVQIPKTIAAMWGQKLAADTDDVYPPLKK